MGPFDFAVIARNLGFLAEGIGLTFILTATGIAGGLLGGILLAVCRHSRLPVLSQLAWAYVSFFRSMPFILILFWIYFSLPLLLGFPVGAFTSALISFIVFEIAYFSEIVRAGIGSVAVGQQQAAWSLGLSNSQTQVYVVVPQALRRMRAALITQGVILLQDTSLVYVVGLRDFLVSADIVANRDNRIVEMYAFIALVYLLLCLAGTTLAERFSRKVNQ
jgi:glutamate/aspartate transport system permease protein